MDYKIYLRRVVALLLCCLLAVYTPVLPLAHASDPVTASLTVAGAGISTGGLEGAALLSAVGPPAAAIIGITLGTIGVGAYVSQASAEAGMTPTQFILNKVGVYCMAADIQKEKFLNRILTGCSVAADGAIALSNDAAKAIQQFGSWIFTQGEDTVVPEVVSDGKTASIGDYNFTGGALQSLGSTTNSFPCSGSAPGSRTLIGINFAASASVGSDVFVARTTDRYLIMVSSADLRSLSTTNRRINYFASDGYSNWLSFPYQFASGGMYVYGTSTSAFSISSSTFPLLNVTFEQFQRSIAGKSWEVTDSLPSTDVFTGTPEAWAENKDVLNPSADEDTPAAVLNPDVLNPIIDQLAEGTQWQMGIEDYLKALEKAWDKSITGIGDDIATIIDTLTGIKKEIAIPDDATKTADLTKPDVVPNDTTPIVVPDEVVPGEAIQGISFELDEVFPFCLPFDVYKMLNLLSADPVAPRYHVHYEGPYNIVIDFTVDLSAWNDVAAICRNMELLLFCVGLAVVTRSIFIRA